MGDKPENKRYSYGFYKDLRARAWAWVDHVTQPWSAQAMPRVFAE